MLKLLIKCKRILEIDHRWCKNKKFDVSHFMLSKLFDRCQRFHRAKFSIFSKINSHKHFSVEITHLNNDLWSTSQSCCVSNHDRLDWDWIFRHYSYEWLMLKTNSWKENMWASKNWWMITEETVTSALGIVEKFRKTDFY